MLRCFQANVHNEKPLLQKFKISEAKFRRVIKAFAMDFSASDAAALTGLDVRSVNSIFLKIRARIAQHCEHRRPCSGEVELDESYFGPRRVRGKRGCGASGQNHRVRHPQARRQVHTEIVPDARKRSLLPVIRGRVSLDSVIHTDGWRAYDGLVDVGYAKHYRVRHGANEFASGRSHINGIESFWAYAKHRLAKSRASPNIPSACTSRRPNSASIIAVIICTRSC